VKALLGKSANVNALTSRGDTALQLAADKSLSVDVAKLLIDANVDRTVENDKGETALDITEWRSENEKDKATAARAKEFARLIVKGPAK